MNPYKMSLFLATSVFLFSACAVAPGLSEEEVQIRSDLDVNHSLPATRHMRDAIETQPIFAQAAFWSNEYDLNPADLESALKLAAAVRKIGNPQRAVEITQTTRALYPRDPYLIAEYAAALIASERAAEAIQPLDEALARTPNYGRLWSLKGAALDQQERFDEARQYYQRALQVTPNDPNVMANIGFSYALSGDAPRAETWLKRAIAQPGASESVRQNLALVLRLQGKNDEAEALISPNQSPQNFQRQTFQSQAVRPSLRPSTGSNGPATFQEQANSTRIAPTQIGQPKARVLTSASSGQTFKSSSEAARAIASQNPNGQRTVATQAASVSPELQQATLNRIANSLNLRQRTAQNAPQATQVPQRIPQQVPQQVPLAQNQAYPQARGQYPATTQPYPSNPNLAGGPYAKQAQPYATPQRREPNRRRR